MLFFQAGIAWAFQKNSPYLELFNFHIAAVRESGMVDRLTRETLSTVRLKAKACEENADSTDDGGGQFEVIKLKNIMSAFAILFGGIGKKVTHK